MTSNREIQRSCLSCGYVTDAASGVNTDRDSRPEDDDVSICLSCGNVAIYDGPGFRWPTADELDEIMTDRAVMMSVGYIRARGPIR